MDTLEQEVAGALGDSLTEILRSCGSLVADSQIRNLNTGMCLVQCGLADHPLVKTMALGKKRYVAYWSNDETMEMLLQYWLQSRILQHMGEIKKYGQILDSAALFACDHFARLEKACKQSMAESRPLPINWYTFIMGGHLLRNLHLLMPDSPSVERALQFAVALIANFASVQLRNDSDTFLDFCLSFFTGLEDSFGTEFRRIRDQVAGRVRQMVTDDAFWEAEDDSYVAHALMDLHIAGELDSGLSERGLKELSRRIQLILDDEPINLQKLTRLTRATGELANDIDGDIVAGLHRKLAPVYGQSILEEIYRRVLDEKGFCDESITNVVASLRSSFDTESESFFRHLFLKPFEGSGFRASPDLEFLDVVKPPGQTLRYGGDCDCVAAMYAAMLLAAGCEEVELFHLRRLDREENRVYHHAVACVIDVTSTDGCFYCLDAQLAQEEGSVPRLFLLGEDEVAIRGSRETPYFWRVGARRTLSAPEAAQLYETTPVGEVHIGLRELYLPRDVVTWTLFYLNDGADGVANQLQRFMLDNREQRRAGYCDIVIQVGDTAFDDYIRYFKVDFTKLPALAISHRRSLSGKNAHTEEDSVVFYRQALYSLKALGDTKMLTLLQLFSSEYMQIQKKTLKAEIRRRKIRKILRSISEEAKDLLSSVSISFSLKP